MNKILTILALLIASSAYALDPMQPVAQEVNGNLRLVKQRMPNYWQGTSNYRKAGDARWAKDGWVQVESSIVVETNVIDRAETIVSTNELDNVVYTNAVDPTYLPELSLLSQAVEAMEVLEPGNGQASLEAFQDLSQAEIHSVTKGKYQAANAAKKDDITSARVDLLMMLLDANKQGLDWRELNGNRYITNVVPRKVWTKTP